MQWVQCFLEPGFAQACNPAGLHSTQQWQGSIEVCEADRSGTQAWSP